MNKPINMEGKSVQCPDRRSCSQIGCSHWVEHTKNIDCNKPRRGNMENSCENQLPCK